MSTLTLLCAYDSGWMSDPCDRMWTQRTNERLENEHSHTTRALEGGKTSARNPVRWNQARKPHVSSHRKCWRGIPLHHLWNTILEILAPSMLMSDPHDMIRSTKGNKMFELHYLGQRVQTFVTRDAALQNIMESAGSFGDYEILDESDNLWKLCLWTLSTHGSMFISCWRIMLLISQRCFILVTVLFGSVILNSLRCHFNETTNVRPPICLWYVRIRNWSLPNVGGMLRTLQHHFINYRPRKISCLSKGSAMVIYSMENYMVAHLPNDVGVVWLKGSHTANVYDGWKSANNVDCFSFSFEKNETSMLDFTTALESWMSNV